MKTYLHLEDGERIEGMAFGHAGETDGEVVFSTGMTGYPQSLTDPSFAGQILTFTYPLIGNFGVPKPAIRAPHVMENFESERIWAKGVIVGEYCLEPSHYQSARTFSDWLSQYGIPAIAGIDTRALTQKLREQGTMRGIISPRERAEFGNVESVHWVAETSTKELLSYKGKKFVKGKAKRIVLIDCGVKHGIIRALMENGYEIVRIPWDANPLDVKDIDGVVCSNGPGDPKDCGATIANIRKVLAAGIPFTGVCLGHQLLSLAVGADTYKLKYGHRGLNQPCQDVTTGKAYVTSQNHGYAVDPKTVPADYEVWFTNLNDGTNEGIRHRTKPFRSTQFHPEGCPGPFDTKEIFGMFHEK
jgi:carbamoyl-phosphate synthase small subunit